VKIDSSNANPLYLKDLDTAKVAPPATNSKEPETQVKAADRIEISPEAKMLQSKNVSAKDLEKIKDKISSNYYNSDKVLSKVADAIMKEINAG
jgi:anti-sigma28 factor (negative regulator of flagellin synthesis)